MRDGRIADYGTYQELLARGVDFHAALDEGHSAPRPPVSTPEAPLPASKPAESASDSVLDASREHNVPSSSTQPASEEQSLLGEQPGTASDAQGAELLPAPSQVADELPAGHSQSITAFAEALQSGDTEGGATAVAAAEQAEQKALDLLPLLAPTITGGAVPEAASGALTAVAGRRSSEAEPRGWRGADGKLAGTAGASRKGRLVHVRRSGS